MPCFGGCFAAVRDHDEAAVAGGDTTGLTAAQQQAKNAVRVTDTGAAAGTTAGTPTSDSKAGLKAKLRLLSSKTPAGPKPLYEYQRFSASGVDREELRQQYLMEHGAHIMAVSTLQQDQIDYFVMPGIGYIPYGMMYNGPEVLNIKTAVGLADPVCDKQHWKTITEAFLKEHPHAVFAQTSAEYAAVLAGFRFTCNSFGGETRMDLAQYNFSGYARRGLRSAISGAQKEGITVEEVMSPPLGSLGDGPAGRPARGADAEEWRQLAAEMQAVDESWGKMKGGRANDVWFINRRPIFAPEPGVRKLVARNAAGQLQGFIFFDGVFEAGKLTGYYANVTRLAPNAHPGTLNLMMKHFIETVRSEAQLAAPAKKLSMSRSQRRKLEAAAAKAAAAAAGSDTAQPSDQSAISSAASGVSAAGSDVSRAASASGDAASQGGASSALGGAPGDAPRFVSLGLSPFHGMDNRHFRYCKLTHLMFLTCYYDGAGFYPFKTLAAAKARYGGGLNAQKRYDDPAVQYNQQYYCHRRGFAGAGLAHYDVVKFYGFWEGPVDISVRYLWHKCKQSAALVNQGVHKLQKVGKKGGKKKGGSGGKSGSLSTQSSGSSSAASLSPAASLKAAGSGGKGTAAPKKAAAAAAAAGAAAAAAAAAVGDGSDSRPSSPAGLIATAANPPSSALSCASATETSSGSDCDGASTASGGTTSPEPRARGAASSAGAPAGPDTTATAAAAAAKPAHARAHASAPAGASGDE